jgi:hypothetical protein
MDCVDCHNRAAHAFAASPERAVDRALAMGRLDVELPFVRREAVAALKEPYESEDAALAAIATRLESFYSGRGAAPGDNGRDSVMRAVRTTQALWRENVFPEMNVTWGTYPSQLGHTDAPGCFRCHDESHTSPDGAVIRQDCELCHAFE